MKFQQRNTNRKSNKNIYLEVSSQKEHKRMELSVFICKTPWDEGRAYQMNSYVPAI